MEHQTAFSASPTGLVLEQHAPIIGNLIVIPEPPYASNACVFTCSSNLETLFLLSEACLTCSSQSKQWTSFPPLHPEPHSFLPLVSVAQGLCSYPAHTHLRPLQKMLLGCRGNSTDLASEIRPEKSSTCSMYSRRLH